MDQSWQLKQKFYDVSSFFVNQAYRKTDKIHCFADEIEDVYSECKSYFEISFQSSGTVTVFRRSYKSLNDTLGNLGGVNEFIWFILAFLYSPINAYLKKQFILKNLYSFLVHDKLKATPQGSKKSINVDDDG